MKTTIQLAFDTSRIPDKKADTILIPAGCGPDVAEVSPGFGTYDANRKFIPSSEWVEITLDESDERVAKVFALLELFGDEPIVSRHVTYSDEDLQTARLLEMSAGSEWLNSQAWELGTKYDLKQACPHCGTGAKQIWYKRVKRKELSTIRKCPALMGGSQIIVDARIRKMLINAGITGISFAEVHARDEVGDWNPIDRFQILIESTLPPMRGELTAQEEQVLCKVCRRGGHYHATNRRYHEEDLLGTKDFNLTWEWFGSFSFHGNARTADFSLPRVLVTPKVMNLFREARVTTFEWKPVDIVA